MNEMKIGIQIYSLREEMQKDLVGTLAKVKEQGYEGVELAGTYGYTVEELKQIFETAGLTPISAHVPLEVLIDKREDTIAYYKELGCCYIAIPWLDEEYRAGSEKYDFVLKQLDEIGKACHENGIHLSYHNHDFEFKKTQSGSYMLDDMYEKTNPNYVHAELDTCWVQVAGVDAADYVRQYAGRCDLIHVKDFFRQDGVMLAPLGVGEVDVEAVVKAAGETGVQWLIVEQDDHHGQDAIKNMAKSREYLKKIYR